ncbi:MAG TPA: hypothetical protein DD670_01445 [Planctomycetaceae bacterium]|nr:hypothetical protein [Planctomycetaceae bacterium]
MSIQVRCPKGHVLRVKDSFAGKIGLCPVCRERVAVPRDGRSLSEDEIIDVLGPHDPSLSGVGSTIVANRAMDQTVAVTPSPPKKSCTKCNREISAGTHICPFCRTYIASLRDM